MVGNKGRLLLAVTLTAIVLWVYAAWRVMFEPSRSRVHITTAKVPYMPGSSLHFPKVPINGATVGQQQTSGTVEESGTCGEGEAEGADFPI
jgi:hypothetical protein